MTRSIDEIFWNKDQVERVLKLLDVMERRVNLLGEVMVDLQKKHMEFMLRVDAIERR
jgi:hypothetical protein